jgi:glucose-1-phosphate thymidylyltransferase
MPHVKGIVLAGGSGTRLWPSTKAANKHLFPVYDKPLIYYSLSTLMLAGIRDVLLISNPTDLPNFKALLDDGQQFGMHISYISQPSPEGLAQAFTIGEEYVGDQKVALILGDNVFHGAGVGVDLTAFGNPEGAVIFGYNVIDSSRYGVVEIDQFGKIVSIEEKPKSPKSNLAIPGLYFFDNSVVTKAKSISKSARGEYEITSILELYLKEDNLTLEILPRGTAWLDCGTHASLNDASNYIRVVEERQGLKVCCPEEIAWRNGWITDEDLKSLAKMHGKGDYADYLIRTLG